MKARDKAERQGKDPNLWTRNVENYTHKQTYYFVRDIKKRYSYYSKVIK